MRIFFHCRIVRFLVVCMGLAAIGSVNAQALPPAVSDALTRARIPVASVGTYVHEVGAQAALVAVNHALPLNPASTMKLVTTSVALDMMGPAYTWKTQAYVSGELSGDILQGDLIIRGSGDPKLVLENVWLFLRQIRSRGIREIRGNLVLDRSLFAPVVQDAAEFDGEPSRPYNAVPDALLLNYKSFNFRFMPNPALGLVSIAIDPPVTGYPVIAPRLGNGECGDWRSKLLMTQDGTAIDFAGTYPAACGEKNWQVHAWQMTQTRYAEIMLRRLWNDVGGSLTGTVTEGMLPAQAQLFAQWESAPLAEVIRDINKYSNNVMARQLLLTLAARFAGAPATIHNGSEVIKTWAIARKLDMPELVVENGSGLSRNERISAGSLARLLIQAFRAPTMPEFLASLPLAGYDGTMRLRLNGHPVAGNAHIKTGSLKEVRALAGYVLAASGKRYAVTCIINHPHAARGQEAQDMLLQWIYENG